MESSVVTSAKYNASQLAAIREEYAKGSTDTQFENFIRECESRNLEPGRHIYFQLRKVNAYDADIGAWVKEKRGAHQTSIDALRLIAQRTHEYQGQDQPLYIYLDENGSPSITSVIPLAQEAVRGIPKQPWAVEVQVYRKSFVRAMAAIARFDAYAMRKQDGKLVEMWERRGPEQLAKCAEALALRKAFPEELGNLYIAEELRDDPDDPPSPLPLASAHVVPSVAQSRGEVNPVPAEGKNEPRPSEAAPEPFKATDADLPAALFPASQTPEDAAFNADPAQYIADAFGGKVVSRTAPSGEKPTKAERETFIRRSRGYSRTILPQAGVDRADEVLKAYVLRKSGVGNTNDLTKANWESILDGLDALLLSGGAKAVIAELTTVKS